MLRHQGSRRNQNVSVGHRCQKPGPAKLFESDPPRCSIVRSDIEGCGLVESVRACDRWVEHKLCQVGPTLLVRGEALVGVGRLCAQVLTQRGLETIDLRWREVLKQVLPWNAPTTRSNRSCPEWDRRNVWVHLCETKSNVLGLKRLFWHT